MRAGRNKDKELADPSTIVISFDLQNVINLPNCEIGKLFYKKKLNVYNLTAHESLGKNKICVIWPETLCGRSGNDIVKNIITWSDSCVPQNRNSIISCAVVCFLQQNPNIESIIMKYSIPGHSCIQEVDNIHSRIEKQLRVSDVWSPLGLVRLLKQIDHKKAFHIIHMHKTFLDYHNVSKNFNYKKVPYTKVKQLKFLRDDLFSVYFSTDYSDNFVGSVISNKVFSGDILVLDNLRKIQNRSVVPEDKLKQIEFSYKWMTNDDRQYMKALINEHRNIQS